MRRQQDLKEISQFLKNSKQHQNRIGSFFQIFVAFSKYLNFKWVFQTNNILHPKPPPKIQYDTFCLAVLRTKNGIPGTIYNNRTLLNCCSQLNLGCDTWHIAHSWQSWVLFHIFFFWFGLSRKCLDFNFKQLEFSTRSRLPHTKNDWIVTLRPRFEN